MPPTETFADRLFLLQMAGLSLIACAITLPVVWAIFDALWPTDDR